MLPSSMHAEPGIKGFRGGTHRLIAPAETAARVWGLRRVFGVTRVADITGLDTLSIPVVCVYRPNSRSVVTALGKGVDLAAAHASGLMEAAEGWHAEHILRPLKLASARELEPSHRIIELSGLVRPLQSAYHPDRRMLWIEGWDLMGQRSLWLPHECVHMDCTLPLPSGSGAFALTTNGLASGNQLYEAISHALCELIERDAATLWYAGPPAERWGARRLDLDALEDPVCAEMIARMRRAGLLVGAWDITTDVGVPVYACAIVDADDNPLRVQYATSGLGCHLSPRVALLRAVTEAAQCRLTYIGGARDDSDRAIYERARSRMALEALRGHLRSEPDSWARLSDQEDRAGDTLLGDVQLLVAHLHAVGLKQAAVVDLSRPGLGFSVVRAVVPGLEGSHDVPGLAPGPRAQRTLARRST